MFVAHYRGQLEAIAALQAKRTIELGPRPGKKSSCVRKPETAKPEPTRDVLDDADEAGSPLHFPDSDDDDLERQEVEAFGRPVGLTEPAADMVDLDDD